MKTIKRFILKLRRRHCHFEEYEIREISNGFIVGSIYYKNIETLIKDINKEIRKTFK